MLYRRRILYKIDRHAIQIVGGWRSRHKRYKTNMGGGNMVKFVFQLPQAVQDEILKDVNEIITEMGLSFPLDDINRTKADFFESIRNEKLINIIGHEDGLLNADKYYRWL